MCTEGSTLKLCTCGEEIDRAKPHWFLYRKRLNMGSNFVVLSQGSCVYFESRRQTEEWVEEQLKTNCFDFNYIPMEGDYLLLNLENHHFSYEYSSANQSWEPTGNIAMYEDDFDDTFDKAGGLVEVQKVSST